jgi:PAS domain S-box-containing protein
MDTNDAIRLLAIGDKSANLKEMSALVRDALPGTFVLTATSGPAGIELAFAEDPDVILLDIVMPGMDGFEVCRRLKADDRTRDIPVVFLTALRTGGASRVKALEAGAEGFLAKPLEPMEMTAQIRVMTKIRAANRNRRTEKDRLESLVAERTQALRQSEALFRNLFEKHAAVKLIIDPNDGRIVDANESAAEFYGWSRDELRRMKVSDINTLPPAQVEAEIEQAWRHERGCFEFRHRRADGSVRDVAIYSSKIESAGRDVLHSIVHDITERKRAEEKLSASERDYRNLAEAVPQIVWATRPDGWNIYFNQRWVDYTGLTLEESHGANWIRPFHPDDQPRAQAAWKHAVEDESEYSLECRLRRADGAYHWWLIRGVPQRDANGKILKWFGTCTDIEEIKQIEAALRQKAADLLASNAELEQFNRAMVGRELRMIELKQEINELCRRLGEPPRHETPPGGGGA